MPPADARITRLITELRRSGVTEPSVLAVLERMPRDLFVAPPFAHQAWENTALPIACSQTISQPLVVGMMTQELQVGERMKVLEIGTGSGYQTAVLAKLARRVYTIERHRPLLKAAEERFKTLGLHNVTTRVGDGTLGWPEQAPFDRIMVTAAAHDVPPALVAQLKIGGILVLPVGDEAGQDLIRVTRTEEGLDIRSFLPVRFVPLVEGTAEG
ncbi:MAG: protein-L-isoaspartate(D-aspartate) O-methyltransferase [Magnetospirillum sp.]|nr:protein-L-isoaspartate(D-aspartate) O-methyltransferase [Magnetospirillum sp.]